MSSLFVRYLDLPFVIEWQLISLVVLGFLSGSLMRWGRWFRGQVGLLGLAAVSVVWVAGGALPGFLLSVLLLYGCVALIDWRTRGQCPRDPSRWSWAVAVIGVLIAAFLAHSRWPSLTAWEAGGVRWQAFHLDMWLLLRLVMLLWEYGSRRVGRPSLVTYLVWCGLPFTVGGPLLRYSEFELQLPWKKESGPPALGGGWWKGTALGALSMTLGGLASLGNAHLETLGPGGRLLIVFGTGPWGFYLLVGGAYGLFRQAAALGALNVPPSFDRPLLSTNLSDFWSRWNMTATSVFRDTLFFARWGFRTFKVYVNTLILFLAVGLWHSVNGYWLLWGLLHGVGFCAFIGWKRWRGPGATPLPAPVGWAMTYAFVCLCWALPPQLLKLICLP
jgi:hypothetical protein